MQRTSRKLALETLAARLALSVTTWEIEPNDTVSAATDFSIPEDGKVTLAGESTSDKDKDFFTFVAPDNGSVLVEVESPNGEFPQVEIEDRASREIFETQPNDGMNSGTAQLVPGTHYSIRVRAKDDAAAAYLVHLDFGTSVSPPQGGTGSGGSGGSNGGNGTDDTLSGSVSESEDNGQKTTANSFSFREDGTAQLIGTSASSDDRDFFQFVAPRTGQLRFVVSSSNGNPAQLEIEDAQGNSLGETQPNDGIHAGSVHVQQGSTYYVRMRSKNDAASVYATDLVFRQVGDSDGNGAFDTSDLVRVMQSGKFRSGERCSFDDGDWNGDGLFDEQDLIIAFQAGNYR